MREEEGRRISGWKIYPGKIAHLWIMHKNYASLALEVVVDKYLKKKLTSSGPGEEREDFNVFFSFSSQSPSTSPPSEAEAIFDCSLCIFNARTIKKIRTNFCFLCYCKCSFSHIAQPVQEYFNNISKNNLW